MSSAEADKTLDTLLLQLSIPGKNSSKYLSESLSKVEEFQNANVLKSTPEEIVEFVLDKSGYDNLVMNSVPQEGSKGVNVIKFHYEGLDELTNPNVKNIGVPESMLEEFNRITLDIKKLGQ